MNLYARDLGKLIPVAAMKAPLCAATNVAKAIALQMKQTPPDLVSIR
jgi:hypothetical protein